MGDRTTSSGFRIGLATSRRFPDLAPDDRLLIAPLRGLGYRVTPAIWNDPGVRWTDFDCVVIRSCWDYHLHHHEFLSWISALELEGVRVWNPPQALRWNHDKRYLRDLAARGVPVIPTIWIEEASSRAWREELAASRWEEVVVKPAVSASAHSTWRLRNSGGDEEIERIAAATSTAPCMLQPFVPEIVENGEWSLIFLGGEYSHSVLKRPAAGDFRVQKEFGGKPESTRPAASFVDQAAAVVAAAPNPLLYARVDAVEVAGRLVTVELELIEPDLFLKTEPTAPERFARHLMELMEW